MSAGLQSASAGSMTAPTDDPRSCFEALIDCLGARIVLRGVAAGLYEAVHGDQRVTIHQTTRGAVVLLGSHGVSRDIVFAEFIAAPSVGGATCWIAGSAIAPEPLAEFAARLGADLETWLDEETT